MSVDQTDTLDIVIIIADDLRAASTTAERMQFAFDFFDTRFNCCFAPSTWTLPSHASLFSGETPVEHGITRKGQSIDDTHATLPHVAQKAGYTTAVFSENPFFSSYRGFDSGIDFVNDQINYKRYPSSFSIANHAGDPTSAIRALASQLSTRRSRSDDLINSLFAIYKRYLSRGSNSNVGSPHNTTRVLSHFREYWREVRAADTSSLTFVNLLETHNPHTVVQSSAAELDIEFTDEEIRALNRVDDDHEFLFGRTSVRNPFDSWEELYRRKRDAYHTSAHYLDRLLKGVFSGEDHGEFSDSLVILTGDHGEMFGEDGMVGHQTSLHPAGVKVPLFVKFPDEWGQAKGPINEPVNLLGISRVLTDVVEGELSNARLFAEELIRSSLDRETDSLVCTVDGPNWNIEQLKDRYDAEAVSNLLEVRRIGLIRDDEMTVYSSQWETNEVRERQYQLDGHDRTLVDEQMNDPDVDRFARWLTNEGSSSVSKDISQRLKDLGYV